MNKIKLAALIFISFLLSACGDNLQLSNELKNIEHNYLLYAEDMPSAYDIYDGKTFTIYDRACDSNHTITITDGSDCEESADEWGECDISARDEITRDTVIMTVSG